MTDIIFAAVGTILTVVWFCLAAKGNREYVDYVNRLDSSEYFMKEFFGIGYYVIELLHLEFNVPHFRKRLDHLIELRGKNNASFYMKADVAAQITYALTLIPLGLLLAVCTGEKLILLLVGAVAVVLIVYVEYDEDNKLNKRHSSIKRDFPHVLSQLALLINAGMPLREAIEAVASRGDSVFYNEILTLLKDIKNGIPDYEALQKFAQRCGIPEVRKFSSIVIQNVKKGSTELAFALMELSQEVWRARVNGVREEGENASAKLLLPIFIIFGGILLMVVVPILRNMNF